VIHFTSEREKQGLIHLLTHEQTIAKNFVIVSARALKMSTP